MATWECMQGGCRDIGTGLTQSAADKAAEKHTEKTKHPTTTYAGTVRARPEEH